MNDTAIICLFTYMHNKVGEYEFLLHFLAINLSFCKKLVTKMPRNSYNIDGPIDRRKIRHALSYGKA